MVSLPGRANGGYARAASMTPEERSESSRKASNVRWTLKATHKGNFKDDFGIDVDCYVLNDKNKTAVISQKGMAVALGMSDRGSTFPSFLESRAMMETIGGELRLKLSQPVKFQSPLVGVNNNLFALTHGFDVTLLIDICKAIIDADDRGLLQHSQLHSARQARTIIASCAKAGIQNLVYKLAGYEATREEVVSAFKMFIREEAREYEKEFPEELYRQWYRIYQITPPEKNRPWKFKHLTENHVYKTLAKSCGKILELTQEQRASGMDKSKRLHQFLSDVGVKALRRHLGELTGIAKVSKTKEEYEANIIMAFGGQLELDFVH